MMPYYRIDRKKKIAAAIILQRWIRYLQGKTFSYGRAMRNLDEVVTFNLEKIRQKAMAAKMLALAPQPGSIEAAQAIAASQATGDHHVISSVPAINNGLESKPKSMSARRRKSSIIQQFKRDQRNRMSFLIKPITEQANICQFPASATTAAVVPPMPGHLLPVLCTPPTSPRDAEPRTDSRRIAPNHVSITNPAPFTGGPNGGRTFITSNSQIVANKMIASEIQEIDEEDDAFDESDYENDDEDEIWDGEAAVPHERRIDYVRGLSAPQLSMAKSGRNIQSIVKPASAKIETIGPRLLSGKLNRTKSAKLARDDDALWAHVGSNNDSAPQRPPPRSQSVSGTYQIHESLAQSLSAPDFNRLKQIQPKERPVTASALVRGSGGTIEQQSKVPETLYATASFDVERNYHRPKAVLDQSLLMGLPDDVLNEPVKHLSLHRGLKFLRAASADPDQFKSVVVKKRHVHGM